ncbi:hypothetical protein Pla52n_46790 [Stieleria varia]|uniref:Uncharacterized protein n=1 Tax=Stieleria varia TaxID=2528005 RepID=A0A5C6AMR0_9BACT|nr:hypothetical protein Pla52n_46790 [Stieleria varia]
MTKYGTPAFTTGSWIRGKLLVTPNVAGLRCTDRVMHSMTYRNFGYHGGLP